MRITNSMMSTQYVRNLNSSLSSLNLANQKVVSGRKFSTASQDPGGAAKAYQLRSQFLNTETYLKNVSQVEGILSAQEAGLMEIQQITETISSDILQGITDSVNPDDRKIIASKLREMQNSMLASLNSKFADSQVFGGSSTKEAPFSFDADNNLLFRGINVNTKDPNELAELKKMGAEQVVVDIGFGLSNSGGSIDSKSGLNISLPGISFMGYGHSTIDGVEVPNNIYTLIGEIADKLEDPDSNMSDLKPYMEKFNEKKTDILISVTELGSKSAFLEHVNTRLENTKLTLNEKLVNVELVDDEEAIMEFKMCEYTYRAALAMGSKILQPSFMDFMN